MAHNGSVSVFTSYSRNDKGKLARLDIHLSNLKNSGWIRHWTDREIIAGQNWAKQISDHLESADLVILLVSADFLASDYCREVEMRRALERHQSGQAQVVPILMGPVDWFGSPFAHLQVLPRDGRPIFSSIREPEEALAEVASEIRQLVEHLSSASASSAEPKPHYRDEIRKHLAEKLNAAYERRETLSIADEDLTEITNEILELRRQQREHHLQPGDLLGDGRFRLIDKIGSGGFATVWKAWDKRGQQSVAIKILHSEYVGEGLQRERFFRGAREMAKLQHQGIVKVIEEKVEDGRFFFYVMEFVDGSNLLDAVLTEWIPGSERVLLVLEAGDALAFAHSNGVMHRDVKPTNILINTAMKAKLTDFDLAWAPHTTGATRSGMLGTVVYAAPEMMSAANQPSEKADVYGLGMTAIFALHGKELPLDILRNTDEFVRALGVDGGVQEILLRAIAWTSDQRFSSVEEFCGVLRDCLAESTRERLFRWVETPGSGCREELWRKIPSGTFLMGSRMSSGEARPRHHIRVNESFYIMSVPVTNAQFAAFNPSYRPHAWDGVPNDEVPFHPVVNVSWYEAVDFCRWLARTFPWARGARLPTEEEWEYSCRATTETRYWSGDKVRDLNGVGWYSKNSGWRAHRVGEKQPNPWGLYDVHGNVWEWTLGAWTTYFDRTEDVFDVYPHRVDADTLNASGDLRVIRGGSFQQPAERARSACRNFRKPGEVESDRGFRVVLPHDSPLPTCFPAQ